MCCGWLTNTRTEWLYHIALAVTVSLVVWTGYRGGQLTHGEDHLTEFMPRALRKLVRLSPDTVGVPPPIAGSFYGARIHPIFQEHCFTCHGPKKHDSSLRLDSYASLMRGGKRGVVIRAGNVDGSELFRRIKLPPDDDDYMPRGKNRPLSADEMKLLELWIRSGASATLRIEAIKNAPTATTTIADVTIEDIDFASVTKERASLAAAVGQLQKRFPNLLEYDSRASADLTFNASLLGGKFEDADLASLSVIASHIAIADFSRTAITDHSAPTISSMKRCRSLRLMDTKITDTTVQSLSRLDQLESLNIVGTRTTVAIVSIVAKIPKLRHLYAGETGIPADTVLPTALKDKVVF
jgi:hypothetical protein